MTDKRTVSIVAIVVCATLMVSLFLFLNPALAGPHIDETWLVAYNFDDPYGDWISATWVQEKYGGTQADVNNPPEDWNVMGQNIFIIGGSKGLAFEAPWIGLQPTWYAITRPDTYPQVTYYREDEIYQLHLVTPETDYVLSMENDVGLIAKGYDYKLRRWIVVVIGYSVYGTAYGAKLVCTQWAKMVVQNSYVVYKCTEHGGTEPTQWSFADFDGIILEYGG